MQHYLRMYKRIVSKMLRAQHHLQPVLENPTGVMFPRTFMIEVWPIAVIGVVGINPPCAVASLFIFSERGDVGNSFQKRDGVLPPISNG